MDVYSIGEMVIDFLPGAESGSYIRNAGGAPANVAIAVARNGLSAGFCGKLGNDDFGRFLERTLTDNEVRVLCPKMTDEAVTTLAFVTLQPNGERSFTFARKPGADMLLHASEVREEDIDDSRIIHAGSCSLSKGDEVEATLRALRLAHERKKWVSFDVNYRSLLWDGDERAAVLGVESALPYVDFLKISEEEVCMVGGEDQIPAVMEKFGICLVVETLGSKGARCWYGDEIRYERCPDVAAVDTTGAGDAFWGAFLSGLLIRGLRPAVAPDDAMIEAALREGNVAGALSVQKKGALSSLPTRAEIEEFFV